MRENNSLCGNVDFSPARKLHNDEYFVFLPRLHLSRVRAFVCGPLHQNENEGVVDIILSASYSVARMAVALYTLQHTSSFCSSAKIFQSKKISHTFLPIHSLTLSFLCDGLYKTTSTCVYCTVKADSKLSLRMIITSSQWLERENCRRICCRRRARSS